MCSKWQREKRSGTVLVCEHSKHLYDPMFLDHLINEAIMKIYSPGVCTR
jgi:hypothetical protein